MKNIAFDSIWRCLQVATVKMSFLAFSVSCCIFWLFITCELKNLTSPTSEASSLSFVTMSACIYLLQSWAQPEGWNPPESSEQRKNGVQKVTTLGCYWGVLNYPGVNRGLLCHPIIGSSRMCPNGCIKCLVTVDWLDLWNVSDCAGMNRC